MAASYPSVTCAPASRRRQRESCEQLHPVAVAVEAVAAHVAREAVALGVVHLEAEPLEPGGHGVDVLDQQRRVRLARRREGLLHADVDLGGDARRRRRTPGTRRRRAP